MKIQQNWNYSKGFKVFRLTGANGMYKKLMYINMCNLLLIVNQEKKKWKIDDFGLANESYF